MQHHFIVLLSGCGLGDGSCIEEVILTYLALERHGCSYIPVAHEKHCPSVNHITEQLEDERDLLTEAARLGRGRIQSLEGMSSRNAHGLIIPGGLGLLRNYKNDHAVSSLVQAFLAEKKPVATMCAGIDFLRGLLGSDLLSAEFPSVPADGVCREGSIFYTPAFRKTTSLLTVEQGISNLIDAVCQELEI